MVSADGQRRGSLPGDAGQLEQHAQGDDDDPDVQAGDRQDVREPGRGEGVTDLRRELVLVGDQQCPDERSIGAECAVDRPAGRLAPPTRRRRGPKDDDRRILHEQTTLR